MMAVKQDCIRWETRETRVRRRTVFPMFVCFCIRTKEATVMEKMRRM